MNFSIISYAGIAVAQFGETRAQLAMRLGAHSSFQRTPGASATDHYSELGIFLNFDESDALNLIELSEPATVTFGEVSVLGRQFADVISELEGVGIIGVEDANGVDFPQYGFGLFCPSPGEAEAVVEGVSIYVRGYYPG